MNQFDNYYNQLFYEQLQGEDTVGIFPGAFKPPHVGHYMTALNACKNNDIVYIYISSKSRALTTQNKAPTKEMPDVNRYANLLNSDKFTNNIRSIQSAGVARMTSASAFRAAISIKDKNTINKNLPDGVDADYIYSILMKSNDVDNPSYGHITVEQSMDIWRTYLPLLSSQSGLPIERIKINISKTSPVRDTYELVDQINNSQSASITNIRLYVGE